MTSDNERGRLERKLVAVGQEHLLAFWDDLDASERGELVRQLAALPYDLLARVRAEGLAGLQLPVPELGSLQPVNEIELRDPSERESARGAGMDALRSGEVAALTVAGGQGTRLGYDGPKGTYPISPVSGHAFFQRLAEAVLGASERYGVVIPWYVMTSDATHEATESYFEAHGDFGLEQGQLRLFRQGSLPVFGVDGRILLADRGTVAFSPDGHGGLFGALHRTGRLAQMKAEGTRVLSVFQVDNPLVRWFDPEFLGLHVLRGSDVSCKSIPKREDREGLGNFCTLAGKTMCIEYSDFPDAHASARRADGRRRFDAGSISIYALSVGMIDRWIQGGGELGLHVARKKVGCVDPSTGVRLDPEAPNAVKLEKFWFDILPHAGAVSIVRTRREEEFAPVKLLRGEDSVETCREAMGQRACRWLSEAGVKVPRRPDGSWDAWVEISPRVAQSASELAEWRGLPSEIAPGQRLFLA